MTSSGVNLYCTQPKLIIKFILPLGQLPGLKSLANAIGKPASIILRAGGKGKPHAPTGADWDAALTYWKTLTTDADAKFDKEVNLNADELAPFVTWGTNPGQGLPLTSSVPNPADFANAEDRGAAERALEYMDLKPGTPLKSIKVDTIFLGSCTNGRIEDLRSAASIIKGKKIASSVRLLVVPGSARVRLQAESEGLDKVFLDAGGEWRSAGCSMCLGMNPDQLK